MIANSGIKFSLPTLDDDEISIYSFDISSNYASHMPLITFYYNSCRLSLSK